MIERYRIGNFDYEVILEVDRSVFTTELAREINGFWGGYQERLEAENGNVVAAVVRLFGYRFIRYQLGDGGMSWTWDRKDSTSTYYTEEFLKSQHEGWPRMEDLGIRVVSADIDPPGFYDVSLSKR